MNEIMCFVNDSHITLREIVAEIFITDAYIRLLMSHKVFFFPFLYGCETCRTFGKNSMPVVLYLTWKRIKCLQLLNGKIMITDLTK